MKTGMICWIAMVFVVAGSAQATLVNFGNEVVYDDVADKSWIYDLSMFANKTYDEQNSAINTLVFAECDNWHMANRDEMEGLWSAMGLGLDEFPNDKVAFYFGPSLGENRIGRYDYIPVWDDYCAIAGTDYELRSSMPYFIALKDADEKYGAWVAANGLVPEPTTILLFGLGSLILRKKR